MLLWTLSSSTSSASRLVAAGQAGVSQSTGSGSWWWWCGRTSDAGAGPKSVRNLFVSSAAALPGRWGVSGARHWELQPSPASFLAELRRCCLGEWREDKQSERGFGAG